MIRSLSNRIFHPRVPADRWGCKRYNGEDSEFEVVVADAASTAG